MDTVLNTVASVVTMNILFVCCFPITMICKDGQFTTHNNDTYEQKSVLVNYHNNKRVYHFSHKYTFCYQLLLPQRNIVCNTLGDATKQLSTLSYPD